MTYQEVVGQIQGKRRFGTLPGVEVASRMLAALGSPQQGMKLIHIAGTNGKGSVSAFLCGILKVAGIKTGMFTSPHLIDYEERIRVDDRMMDREAVRRIGERLLETEFGVSPTMFDYSLAMALLYFQEQHCEAVILETGLGGLLDSTNAVGIPTVTVITRIGYDHMEVLGTTIEAIASEKAGIIKPGTALVTAPQLPGAQKVLDQAAARAGVSCHKAVSLADIRNPHLENGRQVFSCGACENLTMQMLGTHQYENAAAAVFAAELFFGKNIKADQIHSFIRQGIQTAVWPGRMELLREDPFLLVDGAHNSCGVTALRDSLKALFPGETFHFLMGVMADKDYEEMITLLLPLAHEFTTVTVESTRALQAGTLAALIRSKGVPAAAAEDLTTVLFDAPTDRAHKTIAFGSLYFIGELRRRMIGH